MNFYTVLDWDSARGSIYTENRQAWCPHANGKRKDEAIHGIQGDTLNTGIGQGFMLVTPLQLGAMTATLANRGQKIEPRLVGEIRHNLAQSQNKLETEFVRGETLGQVKAASENFQTIIEAMQAVVSHPRGTAYRSVGLNAPYTIAGKTGTAQVVAIAQGAEYDESKLSEFQKDHALFVAFAPVEEPKIAVAVIVENGGSGSGAAAPVARKVMDYYLLGEAEPDQEVAKLSPRQRGAL